MLRFQTDKSIAAQTALFESIFQKWQHQKDIGFVNALKDTAALHQVSNQYQERANNFKSLVVIGVGGSSLGAKAIIKALRPRPNFSDQKVIFWDNNDPQCIKNNIKNLTHLQECHFLIVSKSGTTLDVFVITNILTDLLTREKLPLKKHISVITQLKSNPLFDWAQKKELDIHEHRSDLSGRFSVFSSVGLAPMSFAGLNTQLLIESAQKTLQDKELSSRLASWCFEQFLNKKRVTYIWPYDHRLSGFGKWWLQLWSESLAKKTDRNQAAGPHVTTPCLCLGSTDQHSQLQQIIEHPHERSVIFLHNKELFESHNLSMTNQFNDYSFLDGLSPEKIYQAQAQGTLESCNKNKVPTCSLSLPQLDEEHLAALMMLFEVTVSLLGEALNIDTFNQPGVELGKQITLQQLKNSHSL